MPLRNLTPFGGELRDPEREAAFQAEHFNDTRRHTRLLFLLSAVLNTLFLLSDWRFYGEPHFYTAVGARIVVVGAALACFHTIRGASSFPQAQRTMIAWEWINAAAVAVLVSSRSDLALFVVMLLPSIYYLAVPTSFRWSVASGVGCSAMMLAGYLVPGHATATGMVLGMAMLNIALILVLGRANRLRRMEWLAVAAERRANADLADSRAMFQTMFKTVPIPLLMVRGDGTIVETNDAAVQYLGAPFETLGIRKTDEFYVDPADRRAFLDTIARDGQASNFETRIRLADGTVRTVLLAGMALSIRGVPHIMAGVVDITDRKAAEERIWRAASHDPLTGLPNRAFFQSRLEQTLAQADRGGTSVTLLLLDIDGLKAANESHGHEAGDALIMHTANRLAQMSRDCDTVARLGADEFVIILTQTSRLLDPQAFAARILADLNRPFLHAGKSLAVQASIGIATYPHHDKQPSDLLKDADLALKAAKMLGRNRAVVYSSAMRKQAGAQATAAQDIQDAIRRGQIIPFYQPKVDLKTGRVVGFEALARWNHPVHGLLTPSSFLPALVDAELSVIFGEHMIRHVAADIRTWLDEGLDCGRIAVNLSTAQFTWIGLAQRFLDILQAAGVPKDRLDVEITETVFLGRSASHLALVLRQFHDNGIRIALDDFGTGYASLIHLKQFPIDDIKIDQSFVKDIENDSDSVAIVLAVIELGASLGMNVVAEGVESAGQADFLREKGCPQAQGNLYAPPMAADRVPGFLTMQDARCA